MAVVDTKDKHAKAFIESYQVDFRAPDIHAIREALSMTQSEFAATFGLAIGSVRNWEQGRTEPDASMRSYISVIRHNPRAVIEALEKERMGRIVYRIADH